MITWAKRAPGLPGMVLRVAIAVALTSVLTASCGDVHLPTGPGSLRTIEVTPNPTLSIGGTQQFTAVGRDAAGRVIVLAPTWTIVQGGGTISDKGMFTAGNLLGEFTATVRAASDGIEGTATVTVVSGPLATITVTPDPDTLGINQTRQFTAIAMDAGGNVLAITPVWSVEAGGGSIGSAGMFTAGSTAGTYTNTVQAASGGISGHATVTVTTAPAGPLATITVSPDPHTLGTNQTQQFTAIARDADGNVLSITPVWSVVAGGGTIGSGGLFTAGTTTGTYSNTVQATSGAISGNATVTVTSGSLATITVTPNPQSLSVGQTQQFTAVGRDGNGNEMAITPVWSVLAGGGTIGSGGLFTAGTTAGTYANTVQATSGTISGNATVTVTAGPLATITVTPHPHTLGINQTQQFTAIATDAGGNVLPITPVWSVEAGGGSIGSGGLFTAGTTAGTYTNTIRATSGGVMGNATVTVTTTPVAPLATITVTPNPQSLGAGQTQQFTAVGRDSDGNIMPITPVWLVVAGGGTIGSSGLFTAGTTTGTYANTVRAISGVISGNATVTVTAGPLATIAVTPNPESLGAGQTQQFTAIARDASGNVLPITPVWSVVAGGGTIGSGGLFMAGTTAGTYANTVQATSGAISGNATVTVTAGALATIAVTPNPQSMGAGQTQQFTAVGRDSDGNIMPITPVWLLVAGGGAIGSGGLFTAGPTAGTYPNTVRATSGAISGSATVSVTAGPLATITVTPNPASLSAGETRQFAAVGRDSGGNIVAVSPLWSVVAGGGTVGSAGLFTAGTTTGTYSNTVQATSGAISGNATVTVTAGLLATITITPNPESLSAGETQQFTAVGRDTNGNVVAITPVWLAVAGGGTIGSGGLFTAGPIAGTYSNTVQATSGAISGNATVTVSAGPLATITVTPNPQSLGINQTQQFTVIARDASGNVLSIAPVWSVVAGGGTIDSGGLFTAGPTAGTYANTVQATSGGVTGNATVTVTTTPVAPLATITVTPNPQSLGAGQTQQFTAVGRDSDGNITPITPVWLVVAGGGTIGSGGIFTAGTTAGTYANTVRATSGAISGNATVTVTAGPLATITVTPNPESLGAGQSQQFTAIARDASGNILPIAPVWSVVAGGGTIGSGGLFMAGATAGTYANTVQATSGAISGNASVTVTAGPLATITVTPDPHTLGINQTQQFTAIGRDANGNVLSITPVWSVIGGGGTIGSGGLFTAGTTAATYANTVQVTSGAISGNATVTVTPGPLATITLTPDPQTLGIDQTQQFTAIGRDASGNVLAIAPAWSVVGGGGAIGSGGLFTAGVTAGTYANTVQATSGSISGNATVTVTPGSLAAITVTPDPLTLGINQTQQFTAVGRDGSGNLVAISPVWSVVSGGGNIGSGGLFTAGTIAGDYTNTVQATSGSISGNATVTVTPGSLATITVTPAPHTLGINQTQQFTAIGRDGSGNVVAISPVWSVVASGGTIGSGGLFTAGTIAGTYANTVQATSGGISGNATVNVTAGLLATITVTPNPQSLDVGQTQQFTAVGRDGNGNVVAISPVWSIVAGGGTIGSGGLFTAGTIAGTYANTVQATSGVISGNASVTVTPGPLATITVTPDPHTLGINQTQQFTATGRDAGGNVLSIVPVWSVVASGGTIGSGGLFTAGTVAGTYTNTVQATSGTISGNATITVTPGPLATITVTPDPQSVEVGQTQQFLAIGRDGNGNVVTISPVWSVVANGGTIGSDGLFTADTIAATYTNTVQATSGVISDNATVTVTAGPLATIIVTPNPQSVEAGQMQQFTAIGRDGKGNLVIISPDWSIVGGGGTIDTIGVFTAGIVAGTYTNTVQAVSGVISGNATVTVTVPPPPPPLVDLGAAATHGILAGSTITCVALGTVNATASVWSGTAITGFPPCLITGETHTGDAFAQTAQADLTAAYDQLDAMPCGSPITVDIGGTTMQPGVACSASSVGLTGEMFFDGLGDSNASFVIKAASTFITASAKITLLNNAQAKNIYWLVGSSTTLGIGSALQGNIITFASITVNDNVTLTGRALARNGAVTLGTGNTITLP